MDFFCCEKGSMNVPFEFISLILSVGFILILILGFNFVFYIITRIVISKHFPDNYSVLVKDFGKPVKIIGLTLIRFGNETKCYGTDYQQSISVKLLIFQKFFVLKCCGKALLINDFNKKYISFLNTESYEEILWKRITKPRTDLIVFSKICSLQFLINKKDCEYLKNYIKECNNV